MAENTPSLLMDYDIIIQKGEIEFKGYEQMYQSAVKLADHVEKVQVTDENVKESKKLLASINAELKHINSKRVEAKKSLLEPYNALDAQVKDIEGVIDKASSTVKQQVKDLEEQARAEKKEAIETLFNKRIKNYKFKDMFAVDDFLTPQHLNKSLSMNKVENEMVEWLTKIDNDIKVIKGLSNGDEVLTEYQEVKDISVAMNIVADRQEKLKQSQEQLEKAKSHKEQKKEAQSKTVQFVINEKDARFVELLLKDHEINFEKID